MNIILIFKGTVSKLKLVRGYFSFLFPRKIDQDANIREILMLRISVGVLAFSAEEKSDSNTWSWTSVFWRGRGGDLVQTVRSLTDLSSVNREKSRLFVLLN